jgi:hypothetical protein
MKVYELLTEAKKDPLQLRTDYNRWKKLINMSSTTVHSFLDQGEGKSTGLSKKDVKKKIGSKPHKGALRNILRMRAKPLGEWSTEEVNWMYRQIAHVSKVLKNDGELYKMDGKGNPVPTAKLKSLWLWGNVPSGHLPSKYRIFNTK